MTYCTRCGARLEEAHRYCWSCGAPRPAAAPGRPERPPAERPQLPDHVGVIAIVSAAAAVMFLVLLAQAAAVVLNPNGRDAISQAIVQAGVSPADRGGVLVVYEVALVLVFLLPAILHGLAYYGLRGARRAGWLLAFVLAVGWSLVLVGIPFAYLLWRRDTREAFGI